MVDFTEGCRKFELIGIVRHHSFNDVGAEPFIVEFLCWMNSPDVL